VLGYNVDLVTWIKVTNVIANQSVNGEGKGKNQNNFKL
jgi:hypothetical protein